MIAGRVFGDARLKGRVERILAVTPSAPIRRGRVTDKQLESTDEQKLSELEKTRRLVRAQKARIARALESDEHSPPGDLAAVRRLERELEAADELEELRELTTDDAR